MTAPELTRFMARHKLTIITLGQALGVTPMAVQHWKKGRRHIPGPVVRLIKLIETDPRYLPWLQAVS